MDTCIHIFGFPSRIFWTVTETEKIILKSWKQKQTLCAAKLSLASAMIFIYYNENNNKPKTINQNEAELFFHDLDKMIV